MKKLLVLLAFLLFASTSFAGHGHEYTYNYNTNYDKDVAMTATVGGLMLGLIQLGQQNAYAQPQGYYPPVYGYGYVQPPPPQCVWLPIWQYGQIVGYQPVCR